MATSPARFGITAVTALAPITWGTTYIVTTELLPPDRPLLASVLRALPAGLTLIALTRTPPRGSWWWRAALLGALNIGFFFWMLFFAAYRLPGGVAAVLGAVGPLAVAGLSAILLGERVPARTLAAGIVGVAGVALIVLRASARLDTLGVVAGLVGTVAMALGMVLTKKWGRPVGMLAFTGWQLTAGGLFMVPVALVAEPLPERLTLGNLAGYAYLGTVNTALAYVLWFRGLERLPTTPVAFLALLSPITATVIGWAALGQALTPWQLLGMLLALGSTVVAQRPAKRAPAARRSAPDRDREQVEGVREAVGA
ncbi:putative integral membrane protein [Carbonactinospora thermoautotrophica]|uniref:Putative integral membrane protein n=1 Tax=Carbonactinospora thermoautotrophica TaxID=1469144 RepID=A0A132MP61_9ACTN|nr:EamA family transporter [Carbonactinospora thermoautotrophica]KWW99573.1 putative integral membrane protein [Carbonactinospora thermoautotrophica]